MSRAEFHRRYAQHPEIKSAELIEGVVYLVRRASARDHGDRHTDMIGWLGTYRASPPDVRGSSNATVILDQDNEVRPDISLRRTSASASAQMTDGGYLQGPPELVVEISASQKKNAYRRNGVQEYIVWRVLDEAIDWFALKDGQYVELIPDPDGVIESVVFPGLRLDVPAMLAGDLAKVLAVQSAVS